MNSTGWIIVAASAALVALLTFALAQPGVPLGVPGQWEWSRIDVRPTAGDLAIGLAATGAYVCFVLLVHRRLAARPSGPREASAVAGLVPAAVLVQVGLLSAAPLGYGLTKWVTLGLAGSSGYHAIARTIRDPWRFWADYPRWIEHQDSLHIGTHPPGLILGTYLVQDLMDRRPDWCRAIVEALPGSVRAGFRSLLGPVPRTDQAALTVLGLLTLLACAGTVVPLYLLARAWLPAPAAWSAAALWPLVPSAVLFQPAADAAYPWLSAAALAAIAWSSRRSGTAGLTIGALGGAVLGLGMFLTLAFLAVGLLAALLVCLGPGLAPRRKVEQLIAVGAGFLAVTLVSWAISGANPFVIWWWNQRHHARFYEQFPRSYLAWSLIGPVELAVGLGLPAAVALVAGLRMRSGPGRLAGGATLAVLALLALSGRNLSEVARLWLPLMPPLLVTAGAGLDRAGMGRPGMAAVFALTTCQVLAMQAFIQVVYPV